MFERFDDVVLGGEKCVDFIYYDMGASDPRCNPKSLHPKSSASPSLEALEST